MKIAQIQMHVSGDKTADLRHAAELIRGAGEIDLAVLPEMFCCPYDNSCFHRYGEEAGGEAQQALSALARERGIRLHPGAGGRKRLQHELCLRAGRLLRRAPPQDAPL